MKMSIFSHQVGRMRWWTGGIQLENEGPWVWSESGEAVGSFVWYQGKPDGGDYGNWMYLHFIYGYLAADTYYNNPFSPICQIK